MNFAAKNLTLGQLNAIVKKLGGEEEALHFLGDERYIFPIWKTVKVGTLGNAKTARKQLKAAGINVNFWSGLVSVSPVTFEETEATLHLVRVPFKDLDMKDGATMAEIYTKAHSYGLDACPGEVVLQLLLQHPDLLSCSQQSVVAIAPTTVSTSGYRLLALLGPYGEVSWLRAGNVHPGDGWLGKDPRLVFVRSK